LLTAIFILRGTVMDLSSVCGSILGLAVFWTYLRAIKDPGYIRANPQAPQSTLSSFQDELHLHCDTCNIDIPLRAKHCKHCGYCVERYGTPPARRPSNRRLDLISFFADHHCSILACCVGGNNHVAFVDYLVVESALCLYWCWILIDESIFQAIHPWIWATLVTLAVVGCTAIPVALLIQHLLLIMTNQTSWEFYRRDRIPYLADLDEEVLPFDQGCVANINTFCCRMRDPKTRKMEWSMPPRSVLRKKKKGTCWNNKYYSCC
jgi:palmitoyltransferase